MYGLLFSGAQKELLKHYFVNRKEHAYCEILSDKLKLTILSQHRRLLSWVFLLHKTHIFIQLNNDNLPLDNWNSWEVELLSFAHTPYIPDHLFQSSKDALQGFWFDSDHLSRCSDPLGMSLNPEFFRQDLWTDGTNVLKNYVKNDVKDCSLNNL